MEHKKNYMSLLILIAFSLALSTGVFAQDLEPFSVTVVDGSTGGAVENIVVSIQSAGGVVEQKVITGSGGSAMTVLAPGTYNLVAEFSVFGFPITLASTSITVDRPTDFIYEIQTFLIPVKYVPTLLYATIGLLAISGGYSIIKWFTGRGQ